MTRPGKNGGKFATDTEISGQRGVKGGERELAKWTPEEGSLVGQEFDREARLGANWDQFEANKNLFGVTTSFDESIYTTPLDRSSATFKHREAHAAKLAQEILGGDGKTATNIHIAEERGQVLGKDYDEEDLYGAVIKDAEAKDLVGAVSPPGFANGRFDRKKSITNLTAAPEQLEAAMQTVDAAAATVSRRLSQIHEGMEKSAEKAGEGKKEKKKELDPDAAEFEPSFLPPPVAEYHPAYYAPQGYYPEQQQQPYYYYDPNAMYQQPQQPYYSQPQHQYHHYQYQQQQSPYDNKQEQQ